MSKLTRKLLKVFASNSAQNGQFGSAAAGTKVLTNDIDTIQALPAWVNGWNDATIGATKLPTLEEMQALQYVTSYSVAYILQNGIPEYQAATDYYINQIVRKVDSTEIYRSVVNNNVGNALTDATKWLLCCDLATVQPKDNYTAVVAPTAANDSTQGYSQGSKWYDGASAAKNIYLCVNASVGAAVWVDTGVNLSDLGALAFLNVATAATGGTGQAGGYTIGDILYASGAAALSKLAAVAAGNVLRSGGVGTAPAWGKVTLATDVSGTLPVANGGTGITSFGSGVATWLGTPSSANLAAAMTDKLGSGNLVFATAVQQIYPVSASVASNALTIQLNPTVLDFRSSTLNSGVVNTRTVSNAISVIAPTGATFGAANAVKTRLYILAIDNVGTVELAVCHARKGLQLNEEGVISTTAISGSSTSLNVVYSTTARTNVPYRIVGILDSTQATAGTYATAPSLVAGASRFAGLAKVQVYASAATASTQNANVIWNFGTVIDDALGTITTGASWKFTAPTPGYYTIDAKYNNISGQIAVFPYINGVAQTYGFPDSLINTRFGGVIQIWMNEGDYFHMQSPQSATINAGNANITIKN